MTASDLLDWLNYWAGLGGLFLAAIAAFAERRYKVLSALGRAFRWLTNAAVQMSASANLRGPGDFDLVRGRVLRSGGVAILREEEGRIDFELGGRSFSAIDVDGESLLIEMRELRVARREVADTLRILWTLSGDLAKGEFTPQPSWLQAEVDARGTALRPAALPLACEIESAEFRAASRDRSLLVIGTNNRVTVRTRRTEDLMPSLRHFL